MLLVARTNSVVMGNVFPKKTNVVLKDIPVKNPRNVVKMDVKKRGKNVVVMVNPVIVAIVKLLPNLLIVLLYKNNVVKII
jgi:hypothetical protein